MNYTPLATVIRLISLNCINLWLTMFIISFTGYDPELYLLSWIIIASVRALIPGRWSFVDIFALDFVNCLYRSRFRHQQSCTWSKWPEAISSSSSVGSCFWRSANVEIWNLCLYSSSCWDTIFFDHGMYRDGVIQIEALIITHFNDLIKSSASFPLYV